MQTGRKSHLGGKVWKGLRILGHSMANCRGVEDETVLKLEHRAIQQEGLRMWGEKWS
jgi:hypothetical protein